MYTVFTSTNICRGNNSGLQIVENWRSVTVVKRVIGPCREMIELETFPNQLRPNSPYLLILPAVGDKRTGSFRVFLSFHLRIV